MQIFKFLRSLFGGALENKRNISLDEVDSYVNYFSENEIKNYICDIFIKESDNLVSYKLNKSGVYSFVNLTKDIVDFYSIFFDFYITHSDFSFSHEHVGASEVDSRFIKIGYGSEGYELVIGTNKKICLLDFDYDENLILDDAPSIWHFILRELLIVYPDVVEPYLIQLKKTKGG